jgi:hypothetical protein
MGTSTTETNENEAKCVQMFVAWKVKDAKLFLHVVLVEYAKEFPWNEDELGKLYYENCWQFKEYDDIISDTWLMDDNIVLKTSLKVRGLNRYFELTISISEEERDDYAMRPLYINLIR